MRIMLSAAIQGQRLGPLLARRGWRPVRLAGRLAYLAGRIPRKLYASASSPSEGLIQGSGVRSQL